ncbi:unnamed protein product [Ixodes pacificus]
MFYIPSSCAGTQYRVCLSIFHTPGRCQRNRSLRAERRRAVVSTGYSGSPLRKRRRSSWLSSPPRGRTYSKFRSTSRT